MKNHDRKIAGLTRAITTNPKDAVAYYQRGAAYSSKREYEKAIADLDRALDLNPFFAPAYYDRALAKNAMGDAEGSVADMNLASRMDSRWVVGQIMKHLDR